MGYKKIISTMKCFTHSRILRYNLEMRLVAGLRPVPLGELTALPSPELDLKKRGVRNGRGEEGKWEE